MADDVSVKFGADLGNLKAGTAEAAAAIKGLNDPVSEFGQLTARQVGSVVSLFDRLGTAVGVSLGPIGILSTELVRASQHFKEFEGIDAALSSIGATLFEAITNPLTIAIGSIVAATTAFVLLDKAIEGAPLNDILRDQKKIIDEITAAYGEAAKAATAYAQKSSEEFEVAIEKELGQLQNKLKQSLALLQTQLTLTYSNIFTGADFTAFQKPVEDFRAALKAGNADVDAFRATITQIGLNSPVGSAVRDFMQMLLDRTQAVKDETEGIKQDLAAIAQLKEIVPDVPDMFSDQNFLGGPTPGQFKAGADSIRNQLDPKPFVATGESPVQSAIKSIHEQSDALKAQVEAFNLSTAAQAGYSAEQKVVALAAANNVKLTGDQQKALDKYAASITETTALLQHMQAVQSTLNDLAQQITQSLGQWMSGNATLGQSMLQLAANIAEAVAEALVLDAVMAALGFIFPGVGLTMPTSGLAGLLAPIFGGGKADGGPLQQGKWYMAGERGPEPIWGGGAGAFAAGSKSGNGQMDPQVFASALADMLGPHLRRMSGATASLRRSVENTSRRLY